GGIVRVENAHAVRAAERDPGLRAEAGDGGLKGLPFGAALSEAAVIDDGALRAPPRRDLKVLGNAARGDAEGDYIRSLRQLAQGPVATVAEHRFVFRVDRIDLAGKAERAERGQDRLPDRGPLGGAEHRDGTGTQESVRLHVRTSPGAERKAA